MTDPINAPRFTSDDCLNEEDFYNYVTRTSGVRFPTELESHLSACPRCSSELVDLIRIIYPEAEDNIESVGDTSDKEIDQTLATIGQISRKER